MTSRERLVAVARGGEADQQPRVGWAGDVDALVVAPEKVAETIATRPDVAVLAEVLNPFGAGKLRNLELNSALAQDPVAGNELLERVMAFTRSSIELALGSGADGIFYRLHGAEPRFSSPMEYGGHYLERDRELLAEIADARFNLLFVVGGLDTYFDFVSDLPAQAFGWHAPVSVQEMRMVRAGALASAEPSADIILVPPQPSFTEYLETHTLAGV